MPSVRFEGMVTAEQAAEALVRVLDTCQADEVGPAAVGIRQKAAQLLEQDHFLKPEYGGVWRVFFRDIAGGRRRVTTTFPAVVPY